MYIEVNTDMIGYVAWTKVSYSKGHGFNSCMRSKFQNLSHSCATTTAQLSSETEESTVDCSSRKEHKKP